MSIFSYIRLSPIRSTRWSSALWFPCLHQFGLPCVVHALCVIIRYRMRFLTNSTTFSMPLACLIFVFLFLSLSVNLVIGLNVFISVVLIIFLVPLFHILFPPRMSLTHVLYILVLISTVMYLLFFACDTCS